MRELYAAAALAATPADVQVPSGSQDRDGLWFELYNLSPYVLELRDDDGNVRGVAGPFDYVAISMEEFSFTQNITVHATGGLMAAANQPIVAAGWIVYGGLTQQPQKGFRVS